MTILTATVMIKFPQIRSKLKKKRNGKSARWKQSKKQNRPSRRHRAKRKRKGQKRFRSKNRRSSPRLPNLRKRHNKMRNKSRRHPKRFKNRKKCQPKMLQQKKLLKNLRTITVPYFTRCQKTLNNSKTNSLRLTVLLILNSNMTIMRQLKSS